MKKIFTKILKLGIAIAVPCGFFLRYDQITSSKWHDTDYYSSFGTYNGFYQLKKDSTDVLFLGSSHAYYSFSPQVLYNRYQLRSWNLGSSNQTVLASYYWLEEALQTQSPKAVVLETFTINGNAMDEQYVRRSLDYMRNGKPKRKMINALCLAYPDIYQWKDFAFSNRRYHERWHELSKEDFIPDFRKSEKLKEYAPGFTQSYMEYAPLTENSAEAAVMIDESADYLNRIVELCQKKGIRLILVTTPSINWSMEEHGMMQNAADQYQVDYYDLNMQMNMQNLYQETGFEFSIDSCDYGHPNMSGAEKLTGWLGEKLIGTYGLKGHKDMQWDETDSYYQSIQKEFLVKHETNINQYLSLIDDKDYAILIAVINADNQKLSASADRFLSYGGITYQGERTLSALCMNGSCKVNVKDQEPALCGTLSDGKTSYKISFAYKNGELKSLITIDQNEYTEKVSSILVAVYKIPEQYIVDSVSIELASDEMIHH